MRIPLRNTLLAFLALACLAGCNQKPAPVEPGSGDKLKLGYVLHGLSDFTQIIQQGAQDAAKREGVNVDVVGPAGFAAATDAIALFEGMSQRKISGLVVIPMPGEIWVTPIRQATDAIS